MKMKLFLILVTVILVGSCSVPKSYFVKHDYFESQILLKENKFEIFDNDWHNGFKELETGTWTFSEGIFTFSHYFKSPSVDTINGLKVVEWIETDSVTYTKLYWLSNRKLFPLTYDSSSFNTIDSSVITPNSIMVNDINYQYSPYYFYKVGKIKTILRKIETFKTEQLK